MTLEGFKDRFRDGHPDALQILWLLRYELQGLVVRVRSRLSLSQRRRLREIRNSQHLKINIASGALKADGWINVDASPAADIRIDLRNTFPITSETASLIFCEHFLDHLQYPNVARRFLAECLRILEHGGRMRLVLHDANGLCRAYLDKDIEYFRLGEVETGSMIESFNMLFRFNGFHRFIYDFETLQELLMEVGFSKVIRCNFRESEIPGLAQDFNQEGRRVLSMYVEAVK